MSDNVHALPTAQKCTWREDSDGHHCPRCRTSIGCRPGGIVCPTCESVLLCETATVPVFRTRTLLHHELQRVSDIDAQGVDPSRLTPGDLYFVATKREVRGTGQTGTPTPQLPGATGLVLCIAACLTSGIIGMVLGQ